MHGKQSDVKFDTDCPLFKNCPEIAPVARYHSLAADADTIGEQFHPESIMTPDGKQMLQNFIKEI